MAAAAAAGGGEVPLSLVVFSRGRDRGREGEGGRDWIGERCVGGKGRSGGVRGCGAAVWAGCGERPCRSEGKKEGDPEYNFTAGCTVM